MNARSSRSRSKSKNSSNNSGSNNSGSNNSGSNNSGSNKNQSRNRKKNNKGRQKRDNPAEFWGEIDKLPTPESFVTETLEPLSVVHSLGRAPVPGVLAEPYFAAVYDRAAMLATVLSDAAGLDDLTPVELDEHDELDENDADSEPESDRRVNSNGDDEE